MTAIIPCDRSAIVGGMLVAGLMLATTPLGASSQDTAQSPTVTELAENRYQIGEIIVDKDNRTFTVPGALLRVEPPLEYVAVIRGGTKAYESLLELAATAVEFNLACILIGLDNSGVRLPEYQFDERPIRGPAVEIHASWVDGDKSFNVPVENLLTFNDVPGPASRWTYLGSYHDGGSGYMADYLGTLIGFVHDPAAIIEHDTGLGIGAYGSVAGNAELLPEVGHPISLTIRTLRED